MRGHACREGVSSSRDIVLDFCWFGLVIETPFPEMSIIPLFAISSGEQCF